MNNMLEEKPSLVYVGKVTELTPIPGADFIEAATVVCGKGGKWRGVVKRVDFEVGDLCIVYLPDSIIPESDYMRFMEKKKDEIRKEMIGFSQGQNVKGSMTKFTKVITSGRIKYDAIPELEGVDLEKYRGKSIESYRITRS